MNFKTMCFNILFLINASYAISLGINISNYGGPSFGINLSSSKISTDLDLIFSFKKEDVHTYNYDYSNLLRFDAKTMHFGVRLNSNYSIKTKIIDIQIGPLAGFDRYLFKSKINMPSFSFEMQKR